MIDMNKYMKIAYITLIGLFTTSNSFSQIKNNRMENYKSNFYSYYEDRCKANASINCLNKVHCGYNGKLVPGVYDNSLSYVTLLPSLNSIGNISLTASTFVSMSDNINDKEYTTLYLLIDSTNIYALEELKNKYGHRLLGRDSVLIPAKWFSGEIIHMFYPFIYGDSIVAPKIKRVVYDQGVEVNTKNVGSQIYRTNSELCKTIALMQRNKGEITINELTPDYRVQSEKEMLLLGREINRLIDKQFISLDDEAEYSIMLYFDERTKVHLGVLLPKELSPTDRLWMTILSNAFEQLPSNTLAPYWSANGTPFPCLYLKAKFYKSKWHFSDYRFEN